MEIIKLPVVIDGVKCIEELANRVLDDYEFKGRTIREWADRIANPETNGDRLRSMTDEELAELFWSRADCELCPNKEPHCSDDCKKHWLDWLREKAEK